HAAAQAERRERARDLLRRRGRKLGELAPGRAAALVEHRDRRAPGDGRARPVEVDRPAEWIAGDGGSVEMLLLGPGRSGALVRERAGVPLCDQQLVTLDADRPAEEGAA